MKYTIVYASSPHGMIYALEALTDKVDFLTQQGWTPQGGVSLASAGYQAVQAMILEIDPKSPP